MKTFEKIRSVRKIKTTILIFLVVLLATVGAVSALPITASFTSTPTNGFAPLAVQFADTSSVSTPDNWSWAFGDGGTSTQKSPSYTYQNAGQFQVKLTVYNGTNSDSATQLITVKPIAQFTPVNFVGYAPLTVLFTDTSTGHPNIWNWSFGDGPNATVQDPSKTYNVSGIYSVFLTVTGNNQTATSPNGTITVNPLADFTINPSPGNVSNTFQFNGTTTGTPVINYTWNFGNGQRVDSVSGTTDNVTNTYTVANTYSPNLTVFGQMGTKSTTVTKTLQVNPVAGLVASTNNPVAGRPVYFNDTSSGDIANQSSGPGSWLWNFGDGSTSSSQNTSHIFQPGKYIVTLTVTKNGLSDSTTTVINTDSGTLYLLRSGINGNTYYFRANKYGITLPTEDSVDFMAYPTRSLLNTNLIHLRGNIGTQYIWKFWGANTGTYLTSGVLYIPSYTQDFCMPDIYTVQLNVTDSRDTYTVTKPRLVVVRGTATTGCLEPTPTPTVTGG